VCGRFTLRTDPQELAREFGLDEAPSLPPRFNIAPGQEVAIVGAAPDGRRVLELRRWGLVPHWARDPRIGGRMINARSETVASRPAFRDAFRRRRCLVPADGFYEWADAGPGPRQPYHVALRGGGVFAIAGLWERWREPGGGWLRTCTLLTVPASETLGRIHDRMPAILRPEDRDAWLDRGIDEPARLLPLLRPHAGALELRAVSRRVNRPEHDDAACLAPAAEGPSA
jgi:putative SOS response-associated peptidase YedK